MDGRTQANELVEAFVNTRRFKLIDEVVDEASFDRAFTSGEAKVGIKIPPNYSDRLIRGDVWLLISLAMLFMVCSLGLGLLVSTIAKTQVEAVQFAFVVMLPSVLLSGFVFPRSEMPLPIYLVTFAIPVTYFIEILRGIVLCGAGFWDLVPMVEGLVVCCVVVLVISVSRFRKQLD